MDTDRRAAAAHRSSPQAGMVVRSNTAWTGRVLEVLAPPRYSEDAIRVAWDGDGETIVPLHACTVADGVVTVQFAPEAASETTGRAATIVANRDAFTVPIIEEEVTAAAIWRDAGAVTIHLRTEDVPQTLTAQVEREEVTVEQVDINRTLDAGEEIAPRQEGDRWIIPVVVEEAMIVKRRVLSHELHVTKRTVSATQTVETTIRRIHPEIDGVAVTAADAQETNAQSAQTTNARSTQ